ncbi:hypothetical protein HY745_06125 [Candidatus Desantisbacteria bacterium]|nr:hypothetical protein [Candidatus Desantisbacteria bacterium]
MNECKDIKYELLFNSPFIIASSVIDSGNYDMVSVLSNGVPYIPGSSIRGRIKAAIRQHCVENDKTYKVSFDEYNHICDAQKTGKGKFCENIKKSCPLCRIFGIPGSEITRGYDFSGAYINETNEELFEKINKNSPEAIYQKRTRNKINPLLKRSEEDALFTAGMVDLPLPFEGNIIEIASYNKNVDDKIKKIDRVLILLAMRLVTNIGGNRNRGSGQCRFNPLDKDWEVDINTHIEIWKSKRNIINENIQKTSCRSN